MRTATIRTDHDHPERVAAAVRPDDTDDVETTVDGETVELRVARETTGGLARTVDDALVNLRVADRLAGLATDTHDT
jgi:hypothetical protein